MPPYQIWTLVSSLIFACRPAFRDRRCFFWACIVIMAFCTGIGPDAGVAGIARVVGISPSAYTSLIAFFVSTGIDLQKLTSLLLDALLQKTAPVLIGNDVLFAVDEIKIGKEGKKMPAVKFTHQSSNDNSKPEFLMAHNVTVFAIMAKGILGNVAAMPVLTRIFGGLKQSPKDKKSFIDRTVDEMCKISSALGGKGAIVVADALYCIVSFIKPLMDHGVHVISRVRKNGVAYLPASTPEPRERGKGKRGRKKKYGRKLRLSDLFADGEGFITVQSPIAGETCKIKYCAMKLLPAWLGRLVQFVLVDHPTRGKIVLVCTNLLLAPMDIYLAYYQRFQIELTFKSLVHTIGAFGYRFWSRSMKATRRGEKVRYTHRESDSTRTSILSKLQAYHVYMMMACIACCCIQYLSLYHPKQIWANFSGWRRTLRTSNSPSIEITSEVLRNNLFTFFASKAIDRKLAKFIDQKTHPHKKPKHNPP